MTRIALIGCGYWGERLAKVLVRQNINTFYFDKDVDKARMLAGRSPNRTVYAFGDQFAVALKAVNACIIATPPETHFSIAMECLAAGKDILVEKPMAMNSIEAYQMGDLAERNGRSLLVDDTWRYNARLMSLLPASMVTKPAFGLFHWANPRERTTPEGILWTQGPHPVSLMIGLMGYPLDVQGRLTDRLANLHYCCPGGCCEVFMTWDTQEKVRRVMFQWPDGAVGGSSFALYDADLMPPHEEPLEQVVKSFLGNIGKGVIDRRGYEVVRCLEWTQHKLK